MSSCPLKWPHEAGFGGGGGGGLGGVPAELVTAAELVDVDYGPPADVRAGLAGWPHRVLSVKTDLTVLVLGSVAVSVLALLVRGDVGGFAVIALQLVMLAAIGLRLRREARRHPSRWS